MMQGPFSVEHVKVLRDTGTIQDDTLIVAAAKGPSLLRHIMEMYEQHKAATNVG